MNISYKTLFSVTYTDGTISGQEVTEHSAFSDGRLSANIKMHSENTEGCKEIVTELKATRDAKVRYIDFQFLFADDFLNEDLYVYHDGWFTNEWVKSGSYSERLNSIGKGVAVLKNKQTAAVFGAGYVTANRFWAYIKVENEGITLRHYMEDKEIPENKQYELERIFISTQLEEQAYLIAYANRMADIYQVKSDKKMPLGWCSWSCFYHDINRENVTDAVTGLFERSPALNLLQLDDGWQKHAYTFSGEWEEDVEKFPGGLKAFSKELNERNIELGLWLAPTLVTVDSPYYESMKHLMWEPAEDMPQEIRNKIPKKVRKLDIGKTEVLEHYKKVFTRAREEYGVTYFKLDYLFDTLRIDIDREQFVTYEEDYIAAVYRRMLQTIRDAVGEDAFLLACGAPIPEGAGIFNGARIAPDIVHQKAMYSSWSVVKRCIINIMLRFFYHKRMFYNDADGVLLRDYDVGDGFDGSYHEVRAWATAVAMSGGIILQNDVNRLLSPMRKELFFELLPPLETEARPVNFFEMPEPSQMFIDMAPDTKLLAVFNLSDEHHPLKVSFGQVGLQGKCIVINAWTKEILGMYEESYEKWRILSHSAELFLIKKLPEVPEFLFMDNNVYLGQKMVHSEYCDMQLVLTVEEKALACQRRNICFFVPSGMECDYEVTCEVENGKIYRIEGPVSSGKITISLRKE